MTEDFLPDTAPETPQPTSSRVEPQRDPLKVLIVSTPKGVNSTIHTFYRLGYAQVSEWTKPQPTQNPGEVMSVLSRRIPVE